MYPRSPTVPPGRRGPSGTRVAFVAASVEASAGGRVSASSSGEADSASASTTTAVPPSGEPSPIGAFSTWARPHPHQKDIATMFSTYAQDIVHRVMAIPRSSSRAHKSPRNTLQARGNHRKRVRSGSEFLPGIGRMLLRNRRHCSMWLPLETAQRHRTTTATGRRHRCDLNRPWPMRPPPHWTQRQLGFRPGEPQRRRSHRGLSRRRRHSRAPQQRGGVPHIHRSPKRLQRQLT